MNIQCEHLTAVILTAGWSADSLSSYNHFIQLKDGVNVHPFLANPAKNGMMMW